MQGPSEISAHLVINDTALTEYPDPTPDQEPNTSSRYIAIVSNQPFFIAVHLPANFTLQGDALLFKLFKDGGFIREEWRAPKSTSEGTRPALDTYICSPEIKFPHVVEDTNTNPPGDADLWKDSEVVLQISHARTTTCPSTDPFGNTTAAQVEPLPGTEHVFAFTFKYRPHAVLASILHPSPDTSSSTPSEHPADASWKQHTTETNNMYLYCTCQQIRPRKEVVSCDNDDCKIGSYHLDCVGLETPPTTTMWLCPECSRLPVSDLRIEGWTETFGTLDERVIGKKVEEWL